MRFFVVVTFVKMGFLLLHDEPDDNHDNDENEPGLVFLDDAIYHTRVQFATIKHVVFFKFT